MQVVQGEQWRLRGSAAVWWVASIEQDIVDLQGPGSLRNHIFILMDDFIKEWERVQ
jgi:hypothetical protein